MANTSMYNTSGGLESGLRTGLVIGQGLRQMQSRNALQDAAGLIQQGQDPNAVIQQLMATDPAAAQQLLNMQTQQQQQSIQKQEMDMLQQKYGMQKLQMAGLPLFGAIMQDDTKVQDKLIDEASSVFKGQSDGIYDALQGIKQLPLDGRVNALGGIVKSLRQAGVFPDDPSQMMQSPAAVQEFEYYKNLPEDQKQQFGLARGYTQTGREESRTPQERNFERYNALMQAGKTQEAEAFGRSAGIVSKEGMTLDANTSKRLSDFNDAAAESGRLASKYELLANDFEKSGVEGGLLGTGGTWSETVKDLSGNQDEITELRREFNKIRASEVVKNLPPGAASDADIALALSGFPTDKANAKQVASFLRGVAKLKKYEEEFNTFKSNFISERGTERNMLQEWKNRSPQQPAQQQGARSEQDIMKEYGL